ncbi:MAG: hypothetical protein HYV09_37480 [Deltaproteobacteria bacterium]|nr:hypothetical protein [Deltaproteobacteria bacterium]
MRSTIVLVALVFSGAVACGGAISADPGDGGADTEGDAPVRPETSVEGGVIPEAGGCGWGACSAGTSCSDGCNTCYCESSGRWSCTTMWCEDTGPLPDTGLPPWDVEPPPPDTWPSCPSYQPAEGTWCPGALSCSYPNSCGLLNFASCYDYGGRWKVSVTPCPGACPSTLPKTGTSCSAPAKCEYPKPCGSWDFAYCNTGTGRWETSITPCPPPPPPPPPPSCPTTVPKHGSACASPWVSCAWNNGCGSLIHGSCESGSWWISDTGCVPGCPSSKPPSGTACKPPSSTACTYLTSSGPDGYCASSCFCAEDYRWACLPGECSSSGGGWADAGTPWDPDGGPSYDADY